MSEIRKCDNEKYYFDNKCCPGCGSDGSIIADEKQRRQLSKFVSGLLRHFPQDYNLDISERGWIDVDSVIRVCDNKYDWFREEILYAVIETDRKGRFEYDEQRVRASYGHSIDDVNIEDNNENIPEKLYHGTDPSVLDSIMEEGIKAMNRNKVHMTDSIDEAKKVGHRHCGEPTILEIDARKMIQDGLNITKRSSVIFTSDEVPPKYISQY